MKFCYCLILLFLSITTSYSQEYLKNSKVYFKDSTFVLSDFYYYPSMPQSVILIDSLGAKHSYDLSMIDYAENGTDKFKVINFNGKPKLFISIVEGEKASLYKTNFNVDKQLYIFKNSRMHWLQGGKIEFTKNGKTYIKDNIKYKGLLKTLLLDNNSIVRKIEEISYSETDIVPIIIAYNNGHVSYVKTNEMERQNKKADKKFYLQYSIGHNVPFYIPENNNSMYFQTGIKLYISEGSIHSLKFGIEYAKFNMTNYPDKQWLALCSSYYIDFFRKPNSNLYLGMRLFDADVLWDHYGFDYPIHLRISPLIGYDYHISRKLDLYMEVNNILRFEELGRNFSFGITIDL